MKNKKIAIIGANGQLGSDLQKALSDKLPYNIYPLTHADIEITKRDSITEVLDNIQPDVVINAAAYNNVDESESNPQKAFLVNGLANKYLAEYCKKKNSVLVYISSDYVFGFDEKRNTPYIESDCPGPINAYGISKLAGEYFVFSTCKKYFIIRTSGLFGIAGSSGKEANFIETILKKAKEEKQIKIVDDQVITPTYALDLAKQILLLLKTDYYGTYHATAEGQCSWYEFAEEIFRLTGIPATLEAVTSDIFNAKAKRPAYSVLENEKLKKIGIHSMQDWHICLKEYLKEKKYI